MINRVILVGRITKDPEIRYLQNGTATVSFTIACDRQYVAQNGERGADFINCVAWRQTAEFISRYIKKGYMMSVEGRIQTRQYQDQQGQTRYVTEVLAEQVQNLTPRDPNQAPQHSFNNQQNYNQGFNNQGYNNQGYNNQYQAPTRPQYPTKPQAPAEPSQDQVLDLNVADDDLPF